MLAELASREVLRSPVGSPWWTVSELLVRPSCLTYRDMKRYLGRQESLLNWVAEYQRVKVKVEIEVEVPRSGQK